MSIKKNLSLYINGIIILLAIILTYLVNKYLDTKIIIEKYISVESSESGTVSTISTESEKENIEEIYMSDIIGGVEFEKSKAEYLLLKAAIDNEDIWPDICTTYNDDECVAPSSDGAPSECELLEPGNCVQATIEGCDLT